MDQLPLEIKEKILELLPFEKVVFLSERVSKKMYKKDIHTWDWAAEKRNLELLTWLGKNSEYIPNHYFLCYSITKDYIEVVQWFYYNSKIKFDKYCIQLCSGYGSLRILKWVDEKTPLKIKDKDLKTAVTQGHLELVKWLIDNKDFNSKSLNTIANYARKNSSEIIKNIKSFNGKKDNIEEFCKKRHAELTEILIKNT